LCSANRLQKTNHPVHLKTEESISRHSFQVKRFHTLQSLCRLPKGVQGGMAAPCAERDTCPHIPQRPKDAPSKCQTQETGNWKLKAPQVVMLKVAQVYARATWILRVCKPAPHCGDKGTHEVQRHEVLGYTIQRKQVGFSNQYPKEEQRQPGGMKRTRRQNHKHWTTRRSKKRHVQARVYSQLLPVSL